MSSIDFDKFSKVQSLIAKECDSVKEMLLEKNAKYGNSAVEPKRIFSKSDASEQIKVRIDDKLSRIQNMGLDSEEDTEDAVKDLIGYLILLRVSRTLELEKQLYLEAVEAPPAASTTKSILTSF